MSRKVTFKAPGVRWESEVESVMIGLIVFAIFLLGWLGFMSFFLWISFLLLNWALGVFGYHATGLQFIAGVVLLGIARSVTSYLFNRE